MERPTGKGNWGKKAISSTTLRWLQSGDKSSGQDLGLTLHYRYRNWSGTFKDLPKTTCQWAGIWRGRGMQTSCNDIIHITVFSESRQTSSRLSWSVPLPYKANKLSPREDQMAQTQRERLGQTQNQTGRNTSFCHPSLLLLLLLENKQWRELPLLCGKMFP
jgi:hypothetical protein